MDDRIKIGITLYLIFYFAFVLLIAIADRNKGDNLLKWILNVFLTYNAGLAIVFIVVFICLAPLTFL